MIVVGGRRLEDEPAPAAGILDSDGFSRARSDAASWKWSNGALRTREIHQHLREFGWVVSKGIRIADHVGPDDFHAVINDSLMSSNPPWRRSIIDTSALPLFAF